jgi:glycosyltransferase involved in cell wall biosynthesis
MKIYVEGAPMFLHRTGVGQYTKSLLEHLIEQDTRNHYTIWGFLFMGRKFKSKPFPEGPRLDYHLIRWMPGKVFNAIVRKLTAPPVDLMLRRKPDLFLFPNFVRYPLALGSKSIVIVYDMSYLLHGEYTAKRNRDYLTHYVPISIKKSQHVVTISENAKREIMEHYRVPAEKITIVNPALDHDFFYRRGEPEVNKMRQKYSITKPYILYTGTLEPRKNILGILESYVQLPEDLRNSYSLVLAGGKGWLDDEIKNRLDELKDYDIITTGYVPDEDLPAIYSGASVFVYPSHYEGFGMPPLEAMACGVPVISANNSSLPEAVGDAGILIDADDTKGLAKNVERVLRDSALAKEMSEKGLKRAKKFTWESSAATMLKVINEVGAKQ